VETRFVADVTTWYAHGVWILDDGWQARPEGMPPRRDRISQMRRASSGLVLDFPRKQRSSRTVFQENIGTLRPGSLVMLGSP
jgi:hypothetical protein